MNFSMQAIFYTKTTNIQNVGMVPVKLMSHTLFKRVSLYIAQNMLTKKNFFTCNYYFITFNFVLIQKFCNNSI